MTEQPQQSGTPDSDHEAPSGLLPGGSPDDQAGQSTPGSDGDGPEPGYTAPEDVDGDA